MKLHLILLVLSSILLRIADCQQSGLTTGIMVAEDGYPFEEHEVQTIDGYILTMHRIPYSPQNTTDNSSSPRPVAFLMHGLLVASSDWVIQGKGKALAYLLSDAGYDVWMGNARGNRYSRKHATLSPESRSFWAFSFHQIGIYDLPAMISQVLSTTGVQQVSYFGHSQGGTSFMVMASENSSFTSCIKAAYLFAPATFMDHFPSPFSIFLLPIYSLPQPFVETFGDYEVFPSNERSETIGQTICKSPLNFLCSLEISLIGGFNLENINTTLLPRIFGSFPCGASVNQIYHFFQMYRLGRFGQFDYGLVRNFKEYGSTIAPRYPLENVSVRTFIYYSRNDYLVAEKDVERLWSELPSKALGRLFLVEDPKWTHFDYIWGNNAKEQVFEETMKDMASVG